MGGAIRRHDIVAEQVSGSGEAEQVVACSSGQWRWRSTEGGVRVGGHQVLRADGQQRLPSHGHVATHRDKPRIIDITRTATHRHIGTRLHGSSLSVM